MKKVALLSLFALVFGAFAFASCPVESGQTCAFYGGDLNLGDPNQNGLANENDAIVGGSPYGAAVYQNFNWGGGSVTGLATNNLSGLNPATSNQATGRSDFGFNEYTNFVSVNVSLGAGQYWMAVVPNDPNNANRSFNSDTDGTNSIGSQTSNQQFFNSAFFGANFTNTNN